MNNKTYWSKERNGKAFKNRTKDVLLLAVLAFVLFFTAWKIFHTKDESSNVAQMTETEQKIARLLEEIDGVGDAEVIVCETEDGVQGAVVVCEGARDFFVVLDVQEAVATALGTEKTAVKIYLKKD